MLITNVHIGDKSSLKGTEYTVDKKVFKVKEIIDMDKQIKLVLSDSTATTYESNFWKSDYGKNPNLMFDSDTSNYSLLDIKVDSIVEMIGYSYLYGDKKQFNAVGGYTVVEEIKYEPPLDTTKHINIINELLNSIQNESLKFVCRSALARVYNEFVIKPAAHGHHHNYIGGLLQHTTEVMKIADSIASNIICERDVVITASFFHDLMKVQEYTIEGDYTEYASNLGHVVGSANFFRDIAFASGIDVDIINRVYHCILSHHGRQEWGSPVSPNSIEAIIVHHADDLSAKINPLASKESDKKDCYLMI